jgi:undecaprenyl-diphosphatase
VIQLYAIILGIIEGLTEFLPISSTGHLIVADRVLRFQELLQNVDKAELFEIVIQLGAILAIGAIYRRELLNAVTSIWRPRNERGRNLAINLAIAFLPAAIFGFLFHKVIKDYLFSPLTVAVTLIVGGVVIILIEKMTSEERRTVTLDTMKPSDALVIGLAQVLSLIPGTSRAAATIMGGMLRGVKRSAATEFSFLLAFPVMLAASGYELLKYRDLLTRDMVGILAVGFLTSFVVALAVVAWFIRFVQRHEFTGFGVYRILFGALVLVLISVHYL